MIEHNIELRRHVERIVRPIRGSAHRKTRMREELLVHLTSVLDEELVARDGDVAVATAAAIARFGDPAALRVDLQATVPVVERVLCAQLVPGNTRFGRRPGESVPAFLRRMGPWSFGVNAAVWILFGVFIVLVSTRRPERNAGMSANVFLVFCAANVVLYPLYVFGSELLGDAAARLWATMHSLEPRDRRRVRLSIAAKVVAIVAIRTRVDTSVSITVAPDRRLSVLERSLAQLRDRRLGGLQRAGRPGGYRGP